MCKQPYYKAIFKIPSLHWRTHPYALLGLPKILSYISLCFSKQNYSMILSQWSAGEPICPSGHMGETVGRPWDTTTLKLYCSCPLCKSGHIPAQVTPYSWSGKAVWFKDGTWMRRLQMHRQEGNIQAKAKLNLQNRHTLTGSITSRYPSFLITFYSCLFQVYMR